MLPGVRGRLSGVSHSVLRAQERLQPILVGCRVHSKGLFSGRYIKYLCFVTEILLIECNLKELYFYFNCLESWYLIAVANVLYNVISNYQSINTIEHIFIICTVIQLSTNAMPLTW